MNFRRHTKFSIEAVETPFDGIFDYDAIVECRIPQNKGDLIRSTMLKFTLPKPTTSNQAFAVTAADGKYFIDGVQQATLTLYEGATYTFNVNASGHPFYLSETINGTLNGGSAYETGVTGGGAQVGTVTFVVPRNAPSTLYYYCSAHSNMGGQINVKTLRYRESGVHR